MVELADRDYLPKVAGSVGQVSMEKIVYLSRDVINFCADEFSAKQSIGLVDLLHVVAFRIGTCHIRRHLDKIFTGPLAGRIPHHTL